MNRFYIAMLLALFGGTAQLWAAEECDNENPECCPDDPACEGGENKFNLFTGNISRRIPDLRLAVQVGELPMEFTRIMKSRPEFTERPREDYPFGQAGNWRHSFFWTILDDGVETNGERKIQIINPEGRVEFYHKRNTNDLYMTYLPRTPSRVLPQGTNYYLFTSDGTRHHFTEETNGPVRLYRMESISDPYSNVYRFAYGTNGLLAEVQGPNTNHHFRFTYTTVTNSVDAGMVRFTLDNDLATNVQLAGTFNAWQGALNPMVYTNGEWVADVALNRGSYTYKFYATYPGGTNLWITDPDNPLFGGLNNDSIVVVDPFRLIEHVDASDGRSVSYSYGWSFNTTTNVSGALDVLLTSAAYGDGTAAAYTYYPATYDQERKTLPKTASDPMLGGRGRAVMYTYRTNTAYSGKVSEEFSLTTTQSLGRMYNDPSDPDRHVYIDALGRTNVLNYHGYTANLMVRSNAIGYVTRREYTDAYDPPNDNDQQGVLWKEIDTLGRTTVYSRTWHFGAVTQIVNSTSGGGCGCVGDVVNVYTDDTYPFYLASQTKKGGLTTTWTRDGSHRPTRIDYPDGTYETNAYNAHGQLLAQRRRDGSLWTWAYDTRGRKVSETDPLNTTTYYGYDANDRLSTVSNAVGSVTRYSYNWRGSVTNVLHADGTQEKTWYNTYGDITQRLDRAGGVTVHRYDSLGQLSEVVDPAGGTNRYVRDAAGQLVSTTTALGLTVSNTYDAIGRKIRETFSSDNTYNEWRYDPDGVRTQINRLGGVSLTVYDGEKRVSAQRDPSTNWMYFAYDDAGNRTRVTNALGGVFEFTYDAAGRQTSARDCEGNVVSNVFDGLGRLVLRVDPNGVVTSNAYDAAGRVVAIWRGGLLVASNTCNALGWVVARRDANGLVVSNTFDSVGRPLRTYLPDGTFTENTFSNTYLVQSVDRAGRSTRYQRDVVGRITNQVDNATNSVRYAYDASGNLTDLFDQNNRRTRFQYDTEGRQIAKVYDDGVTNSYAYDSMGRLTAKTDGKGVVTAYRYDAVGNLTNVDYAADADVSFSYDALNRMTRMVDGVGTTLYAFAGSCSKVASADGPFDNDTITYGYDDGKRLVALTSATAVVTYSLDALDRITHVISRVGTNDPTTNAYTYVSNGRLVDDLVLGNGVIVDSGYDALFRLTNRNNTANGSNVASFAYTYNDSDLRTSVTIGDSGSSRRIDYSYDPVGQLIAAQGNFPGHSFDYAYDPAGNPTRQNNNGLILSNAFNNLNQNTTSRWSGTATVLGTANMTNGTVTVNTVAAALRAVSSGEAVFAATNLPVVAGSNTYTALLTDPFGRVATNRVGVVAQDRGYGYDANGNMTNDGQFVYVWDNADRLKEVRSVSGSLVMSCRYDGMGRRRERIVHAVAGVADPGTNRYAYMDGAGGSAGWLVVEVRDGSTNTLETYTHGVDLSGTLGSAGGIGGILAVVDNSDPEPVEGWFHYDGNGNVIACTDPSRTVVSRLEYGPFGTVLVQSGTLAPRYQFSSKEFDAVVGLNYYGFRYYSAEFGKWMNRDPIGENGGLNVYSFTGNSPIIAVDPDGRNTAVAIVAICVGVGAAIVCEYYGTGCTPGDTRSASRNARCTDLCKDCNGRISLEDGNETQSREEVCERNGIGRGVWVPLGGSTWTSNGDCDACEQ